MRPIPAGATIDALKRENRSSFSPLSGIRNPNILQMGDAKTTGVRVETSVVKARNGAGDRSAPSRRRPAAPRNGTAESAHERDAGRLKLENEALGAAIDHFPTGTIVVASDQSIVKVNRAAKEMMALEDGLSLEGGTVSAKRPEEAARIRLLLQEVIAADGDGTVNWRTTTISRDSHRRPFQLLMIPLRTEREKHANDVAIYICDPEQALHPNFEILQIFYSLTAAEARFAAELINGRTIEQVAQSMGIEMSTARTHLKKIFGKTQTNRQGELVRLLTRGLAALNVEK